MEKLPCGNAVWFVGFLSVSVWMILYAIVYGLIGVFTWLAHNIPVAILFGVV
jgi:hypothetical protein